MENIDNQTYNAIYIDGKFEKVTLSELANKGGAEGKIFCIKENEKLVAKVFHHKKDSQNNRQKLEAMMHNTPDFPPTIKDGIEYVQIAWPVATLEDEAGFCVGYLMPKIDVEKAVSLDHLMQKAVRKKLNLSEKYNFRVFAAYNVAAMASALHKCEHYIIDLKPSNIYVYKENMMVAMVDCDGFSIKGEHNNRYNAKFVSEEYIYPEGSTKDSGEMGIEQDKFALAVVIFKLLNNGIHPFSGIPRKTDEKMLTIQERIDKYHYAYGLWPDMYQAPHPYSIHEYFDHRTLELFERAFAKNQIRPTAEEWVEHIALLLTNIKICKKNSNHGYFTGKGCGMCISEAKFRGNISTIKKQQEAPQTLRGVEISELSTENVQKSKEERLSKDIKLQNFAIAGIVLYMLFFTFLYKIIDLLSLGSDKFGIGLQAAAITSIMIIINNLIEKLKQHIPLFESKSLTQMLQVYAFICMLIAIVSANNIPIEIFDITILNNILE